MASEVKEPPTPPGYVPVLIPLKLVPVKVAIPLAFVVALPALLPFRVKLTVLPLTGELFEESVAESVVMPPDGPDAGATLRVVAGLLEILLAFMKTLESLVLSPTS